MSRRRRRSRARARGMLSLAGPAFCILMRRWADEFLREIGQFRAISEATLDEILALNGKTARGRDLGLDGPSARQVFDTLPTTTYADYVPYVERIAAGEPNVMTSEPVFYFAMTSGTTGPPKMIPVTRLKMRRSLASVATSMGMALRAGALGSMRGPFLQIVTEHLGGTTPGGLPTGAVTTGALRSMGGFKEMVMSSPGEVARIPDQGAARYLHLLFALTHERLWTISSFFPATVLFTLRDLHDRAETLVRDVADGTIDAGLDLPAETRARLKSRLRPARRRARALEALRESDRFTVPEIWPDVGTVLTVAGGAFHFYIDQLRPFLGDVSIFSPLYIASEGTFGLGFAPDRTDYLLLPRLNYIELLPTECMDDPDAKPIPAADAEPGRSYEVVITTLDGLMRYRLHDIVKVIEFRGETPVVEFVERRGQVVDIVGEKTAEHHVVEAIDAAGHVVDEPLVDYFVAPDMSRTPAGYVLAIEEWHGDCKDNKKALAFVRAVDEALCRIAPDYGEEVELGTLAPMGLVLLRPGAFARLRKRRATVATDSQIKTPHVVPDPSFIEREFRDEVLSRS